MTLIENSLKKGCVIFVGEGLYRSEEVMGDLVSMMSILGGVEWGW